ncbi:helix-turn-helix domain-containing protein [Pollutimonas sp. M17]|uniref:helix-turn-helix domain-containing protein n=1 Tax=Pollutimonas sp. M17 TaxID=2962065 RepID=UPI0021F425B6|nr:AraC family transcriptional regulator [Pollutimonas sp. M17]UYO92236.1 AraC family transcriptional regulator [Pollutimonas sp. M17]HWK70169.1 AraC family transcriptional regulator [Burkholderiaceae bacterium]
MSVAPPTPETDESVDQHLMLKAKHFLSTRLAQPPHMDELAQALGVSKKRVSQLFRQSLGLTVTQFLREERMRRAQRLLMQTSLDIQAIALELGFSSAANFSNAFHGHVGMSPSDFRKAAPLDSITSLQGSLQWSSPGEL